MNDTDKQRDQFVIALHELQRLHDASIAKGQFLKNVVQGRETVSFPVVERCREAMLQLKQAQHGFDQRFSEVLIHPNADQAALEAMSAAVARSAELAGRHLHTILSWVPSTPQEHRRGED